MCCLLQYFSVFSIAVHRAVWWSCSLLELVRHTVCFSELAEIGSVVFSWLPYKPSTRQAWVRRPTSSMNTSNMQVWAIAFLDFISWFSSISWMLFQNHPISNGKPDWNGGDLNSPFLVPILWSGQNLTGWWCYSSLPCPDENAAVGLQLLIAWKACLFNS